MLQISKQSHDYFHKYRIQFNLSIRSGKCRIRLIENFAKYFRIQLRVNVQILSQI